MKKRVFFILSMCLLTSFYGYSQSYTSPIRTKEKSTWEPVIDDISRYKKSTTTKKTAPKKSSIWEPIITNNPNSTSSSTYYNTTSKSSSYSSSTTNTSSVHGSVVYDGKSDFHIIETNKYYVLVEWYNGPDFSKGDKITGDLHSYGFKYITVNGNSSKTKIYIENYWTNISRCYDWLREHGKMK